MHYSTRDLNELSGQCSGLGLDMAECVYIRSQLTPVHQLKSDQDAEYLHMYFVICTNQ